MVTRRPAAEQIITAVTSWEGVRSAPGQFGATAFQLGRREIGHIHADGVADLPFPHHLHDQLIAAGRAEPHRYLPQSGWVTFAITQPNDIDDAIELFRLSYDHARRLRVSSA